MFFFWIVVAIVAIILLAWIVHLAGGGLLNLRVGHFVLNVGFTLSRPERPHAAVDRATRNSTGRLNHPRHLSPRHGGSRGRCSSLMGGDSEFGRRRQPRCAAPLAQIRSRNLTG